MVNSEYKPKILFFRYWLPVLVYAVFIFFLSSFSFGLPALGVPFLDKSLHLAEYAGLGVLFSRAMRHSFVRLRLLQFYFWVIFICGLYGASDEFHQLFVACREFRFTDILADAVGAGLGAFVFFNYGLRNARD